MKGTSLADLTDVQYKSELNIDSLEPYELMEEFHNGLNSYGTRLRILNKMEAKNEVITDLCRSYEFSNSKDIFNFIVFLVDHSDIDLYSKLECITTLYNCDMNPENLEGKNMNPEQYCGYFYNLLVMFMNASSEKRPSISMFIDILKYLSINFSKRTFSEQFPICVKWYLSYGLLDDYIYKSILGMQRDDIRKCEKRYLDYFYSEFFKIIKDPKYKILTGQYMLNNSLNIDDVQQSLLEISLNPEVEYNTRADSADTLLKTGTEKYRDQCIQIINELGKSLGKVETIYNNRQNAHDSDIDASVKEFLLSLGGVATSKIIDNGTERFSKYEDAVESILSICNGSSNYSSHIQKIQGALLRIKIDQIIYPGSQTLTTIFLKIYELIKVHSQKDLLMQRLIEELIDMDSTCSGGHCNRLVNVFSGIDGFSMNIGFRKQIGANIIAQIQTLIKTERDEKYVEQLFEEMGEKEIEKRPAFNKFYKRHITSIFNDLFKEYVPTYLESQLFELYFREGISFFETGSY